MSSESDRPEARLAAADEVLAAGASGPERAEALLEKADALEDLEQIDEALRCIDGVIADFGDDGRSELQRLVAEALAEKGWMLLFADRPADALGAVEELLARLSIGDASRETVADAQYLKGRVLRRLGRLDEAVVLYDQAAECGLQDGTSGGLQTVAFAQRWKARALHRQDDREGAIAACDRAISLFQSSTEPELRDTVTYILGDKSRYLMELRRYEEAMAVIELVVERRCESDVDDAEDLAAALLNRVACLSALERTEDQIAAADELVSRSGNESDSDVRRYVTQGAYMKAHALLTLGRLDEAIAAFAAVVARVADDQDDELRRRVAEALYGKAYALVRAGRGHEAIPVYEEIESRFVDDAAFRADVARALLLKGARLAEVGDDKAAFAVWDALIRWYGDDTDDAVREHVVSALERKVATQIKNQDLEEARATLDEVLVRAGGEDASHVIGALANKAYLLSCTDRDDEAEIIGQGLLDRLALEQDGQQLVVLARGLMPRVMALFSQGRSQEAIAIADAILARCDPESEPGYRRQAAIALANRIEALGQLGDMDEAFASHRRLVEEFGEEAIAAFDEAADGARVSADPRAAQSLAGALFKKGMILSELGRQDEADRAFTEVIVRFENSDDETIQRIVGAARECRELEDE